MRRSDLEVGSRYAGPRGQCYEIVDLAPGWRVDYAGEWIEDSAKRTRNMPGRGATRYRSNLSVRAYLIRDDGSRMPTVVDPRKLASPWEEHEAKAESESQERVYLNRLVALLRRNLREYPGYTPSPNEAYGFRDGSSVTLPLPDLLALMDLAFGGGRENEG